MHQLRFNASSIVCEILEDNGYIKSSDLMYNSCAPGEYSFNYRPNHSFFKIRSKSIDNDDYCLIIIDKHLIKFYYYYDGENHPRWKRLESVVDLADPNGLDDLHSNIINMSKV